MDRCSGCPALLNISMPECLKKKSELDRAQNQSLSPHPPHSFTVPSDCSND